MPMPEAMKNKMREFTQELSDQIGEINGNPRYSPDKKVKLIGELKGAPKEDMYEFLNANFRTGPGLAEAIKKVISKNRPVGGPKETLNIIKKKLKGSK